MVKFVRIYRNNEYTLIPLNDYLKEYHYKIPDGWEDVNNWLSKVFKIRSELEYINLKKELQVEDFNISKIRETYLKIKEEEPSFDEDILMFISFLFGTMYFSKIGNPSLNEWLNSFDINHPFKNKSDYGFSFIDVLQYEFGQNAIRKILLSTLHWISSQSGG